MTASLVSMGSFGLLDVEAPAILLSTFTAMLITHKCIVVFLKLSVDVGLSSILGRELFVSECFYLGPALRGFANLVVCITCYDSRKT